MVFVPGGFGHFVAGPLRLEEPVPGVSYRREEEKDVAGFTGLGCGNEVRSMLNRERRSSREYESACSTDGPPFHTRFGPGEGDVLRCTCTCARLRKCGTVRCSRNCIHVVVRAAGAQPVSTCTGNCCFNESDPAGPGTGLFPPE